MKALLVLLLNDLSHHRLLPLSPRTSIFIHRAHALHGASINTVILDYSLGLRDLKLVVIFLALAPGCCCGVPVQTGRGVAVCRCPIT